MSEKHLGVDVGRVDTVQKHELGFRVQKSSGRWYRYVVAGATIALGDVLQPDTAEVDFPISSVQPTSAVDQIAVGCWPNENTDAITVRAAIADNAFFWMHEKGDALVKAAGTVVAGAPANSSATAGTVDDIAAAAGNALAAGSGVGMYFVTTTTGGFARVMFS